MKEIEAPHADPEAHQVKGLYLFNLYDYNHEISSSASPQSSSRDPSRMSLCSYILVSVTSSPRVPSSSSFAGESQRPLLVLVVARRSSAGGPRPAAVPGPHLSEGSAQRHPQGAALHGPQQAPVTLKLQNNPPPPPLLSFYTHKHTHTGQLLKFGDEKKNKKKKILYILSKNIIYQII